MFVKMSNILVIGSAHNVDTASDMAAPPAETAPLTPEQLMHFLFCLQIFKLQNTKM